MLDSSKLHQIWLAIEQMPTDSLLGLSDLELVKQIQEQLEQQRFFTTTELYAAHIYIQSRIPLIRDLTEYPLAST